MATIRSPRGYIVAAASGLIALLSFIALPFIDISAPFVRLTLSGVQAATFDQRLNYLLVIPGSASLATLFAGIPALLHQPKSPVRVFSPAVCGLIGLATYAYMLSLAGSATAAIMSISGSSIPFLSLYGSGFWLTFLGLAGIVVGSIIAANE